MDKPTREEIRQGAEFLVKKFGGTVENWTRVLAEDPFEDFVETARRDIARQRKRKLAPAA